MNKFKEKWKALCKWWQETRCRKNWHDYHDATGEDRHYPMHFHEYTCRFCGKKFEI